VNVTGAPRWRVDILLEAARAGMGETFVPAELAAEPTRAVVSPQATLAEALARAFEGVLVPAWLRTVLLTLTAKRETRPAHHGAKRSEIARAGFAIALPRLGAVTAEIALHDGNVTVAFVTSEPATAAALEADRAELARALARSGLGLAGIAARAVPPRPVLEAQRRIDGWT
jgi:Flagellar hook-length control protein FliK